MDDSQVSNTEKYVNSAHSPSTACILQSTAPLATDTTGQQLT